VAEYSAKVELARQKILAGVLGVSVSDLVRRDAARELFRTRRRLRLTIAVCACMAILLGWAGFEHTRAENLIRQMRIVEEERRLIDLKSEQLRIQLAINELSETKREELERELAILRSEKKANEVRGNQVYDLKNAPKIGETTKFDTTTAGYIGSGS
jgi:hypothetical protein